MDLFDCHQFIAEVAHLPILPFGHSYLTNEIENA